MIQKFQSFFAMMVNRIENHPAPLVRYFYLFFAILSLRLSLEFFSSHRLFTFDDVLHIGLWFIFIVTAFLLQLHLFSGEKITKITRLTITCFTLALTAPILDLLLTGGQGAKMNYLSLNSWQDVVWGYFTVGGSSFSRGATPGIRVEIVLLVLASVNYVYTKTGRIVRSLISGWSIYTVLFISGGIPMILGWIVDCFQLNYQADDQSTLLLLFSVNGLLLFVALWRYSPEKMKLILKSIPWGVILTAVGFALIGAKLALKSYPDNWTLNPTSLFWFPVLAGLCLCFGAWLSLKKIVINNNRASNGLLLLILFCSAIISTRTFFAASLVWALLFMLYEPPLSLAKVPFLRHLFIGMAFVAVALLGFSTFGGPMVGFPAAYLFVFLFGGIFGGIFADHTAEAENIFPWYPAWSPATQKYFRWISVLFLVVAYILVSLFLLAESPYQWLFPVFSIPVIVLIFNNQQKIDLILYCLFPSFIFIFLSI